MKSAILEPVIAPPEIIETTAQRIAYIPIWVPVAEISATIGPGLVELSETLADQEITPSGAWLTRNLARPATHFDLEICFPVDTPVKPAGRVLSGELRSATLARTIYTGPYSGLADAWTQLHQWIHDAGLTPETDSWQRYLAGPDSGVIASKFRTELNQPLKPSL